MPNLQVAKVDILDSELYIHRKICNQKRVHFSLHLQTPEQTHQEENIQIRTYKKEKSDSLETV